MDFRRLVERPEYSIEQLGDYERGFVDGIRYAAKDVSTCVGGYHELPHTIGRLCKEIWDEAIGEAEQWLLSTAAEAQISAVEALPEEDAIEDQ